MAIKPISDYTINEDAFVLINMLDRVLENVRGVYEQQGVPLPARQFWMLGEPAEDCEQVVVSFVQSYLGLPGDAAADAQQCNVPRTAVLNITVTREHPAGENGKAVRPDRIIAASSWGAIDVAVLTWGLSAISASEDGMRGAGVIATVSVAPPMGMMQTTTLNLSMVIS